MKRKANAVARMRAKRKEDLRDPALDELGQTIEERTSAENIPCHRDNRTTQSTLENADKCSGPMT